MTACAPEAEARETQSEVSHNTAETSVPRTRRASAQPQYRLSHGNPAQVKMEHGLPDASDAAIDPADDDDDTATLRPAPPPSAKRRESEAALGTPELPDTRPNKKRKRASSPPWTFPTAETATLKTADGRRVSARHTTATPALSEAEERGRSDSQSVPRSRQTSPPWKKFQAEGPTTLQVDGKRKSGRVNRELADPQPKRVSPRTKKQVDRLSKAHQNGERTPSAKQTSGASSKMHEFDEVKRSVGPDRPSSSSASSKKIAELRAKIAALQPTRSFPSTPESQSQQKAAHKRKHSRDVIKKETSLSPPIQRKMRGFSNADSSPEKPKPSPTIKLRLPSTRQVIPPPHPHAKMPSPIRPPLLSLHQLIDEYELKEMQQPFNENERGPPGAEYFVQRAERQAVEEGAIRQRLLKEAESGGALSKDHLSLYQEDRQPEPPQQYGHCDYLVTHALYLRQLQLRERAQHRLLAKKIAYEALDKWKAMNGPTEEDIIAEQNKVIELVKKQVILDMKAKWELVEAHVQDLKKKSWEAEQEHIRAKKLQEKLEWSENLLAKQRGDADSGSDADEDEMEEFEDSDQESDDGDAAENMSESESDAGHDDEEDGEMDADALAAYLAQREAEPPDRGEDGKESAGDADMQDAVTVTRPDDSTLGAIPKLPSQHGIEEDGNVDDSSTKEHEPTRRASSRAEASTQLTKEEAEIEDHLSSDESTDMNDSDENMSSDVDEINGDDDEDDDEEEDDSEDGQGPTLAWLYREKQPLREKEGGLPTPMTSVENGGDNEHPTQDSDADLQVDAGADQPDNIAMKDDQFLQEDSAERQLEGDIARQLELESEEDSATKTLVPAPTLLRGTLRSYQHAGVDWLASLYRNGTNGILADEMGLGKTIQTIALLAHLAEEHEVWDTHLVIVPTSVILNWVTEFQKFLPGFRVLGYYGTAEERQHKRKGWTNDPHHEDKSKRGYNVVVTSYNVAMQDINAIRNVQWHYLILDEAHNIRNFNSQRWQVLIRLRTRARLLLTGTPLQNDLAEVWSLLTFLTAGDDDSSHGALEEFLSHWKDPVKEIFEKGVQKISEGAQKVVDQLHVSLRPFLLRRKKSEVEKDLPKKTESVVVCKLSKRQRQLYQDYMGLAETKATLAKGSGVQAGAVLLSLRRVCNHPDLFDPRPIQTSFAMDTSPLEAYSVKEQLLRRLLGTEESAPAKFVLAGREGHSRAALERSRSLAASGSLRRQVREIEKSPVQASEIDPSTLNGARVLQRVQLRNENLQQLRASIRTTEAHFDDAPIYGSDLRELVTLHKDRPYLFGPRRAPNFERYLLAWTQPGHRPLQLAHPGDLHLIKDTRLHKDIATLDGYADRLQDAIVKFTVVPPLATVPILDYAIPRSAQYALRSSPAYPRDGDWGHESRVRSSIAFPDSRLLIYDSGKLQRLVYLLRDLQSRGSRSLIFTQMTGTLNILEQFLNLLNLPYLRLDGSTPVERRQLYSAEFNRPDSRYQCMILSSRAGGVGLNLTGASSVIFYDLDWNPQMDRQCMDRAHRIGQVRDVEVYKMVSEKTVEENILRRANQKSLLDQTVIQEGHFTTEYQHPRAKEESSEDSEDEVAVAIERFLGGEEKNNAKAMESVEDKEDVQAAQQAAKEDRQDDVDFAERSSKGPSKANTPGPGIAEENEVEAERKGHVDLYMIRHMKHLLQDWVYVPPPVRRLDKHGRDPSHRPKRKR